MKLQPGDAAPELRTNDYLGNPVRLHEFKGRWVLLSFYRYASCPFCNLRVHKLSQQAKELQQLNLSLIGVFQSPPDAIAKHAGARDPVFPLIADPSQALYAQFGLETSWVGVLTGMIFKMPTMMAAMFKGFLPGSIEGEFTQMPADFLINPDGIIVIAKYGTDLGDHLPLELIYKTLQIGSVIQPAEEAI